MKYRDRAAERRQVHGVAADPSTRAKRQKLQANVENAREQRLERASMEVSAAAGWCAGNLS